MISLPTRAPEDSSATEPMEDSLEAEGPQGLLSPEDSPEEDEGSTGNHSVDPLDNPWPTEGTETTHSAVNSDLLTDAPDAEEQAEPAMSDVYDNFPLLPSPQLPDPDLTPAAEIKRGHYELRIKTAAPSRLMFTSSGTELPRGGRDVTQLKD